MLWFSSVKGDNISDELVHFVNMTKNCENVCSCENDQLVENRVKTNFDANVSTVLDSECVLQNHGLITVSLIVFIASTILNGIFLCIYTITCIRRQ